VLGITSCGVVDVGVKVGAWGFGGEIKPRSETQSAEFNSKKATKIYSK
jgi:hypothetical protein